MSAPEGDGPAGMAGILFTETRRDPLGGSDDAKTGVLALAVRRRYA